MTQLFGYLLFGPVDFLRDLLSPSFGLSFLGGILIFLGVGLCIPPTISLVFIVYGRAGYTQRQCAGVSASILPFVQILGFAIAPPIGGAIYDHFSFAIADEAAFLCRFACLLLPALRANQHFLDPLEMMRVM